MRFTSISVERVARLLAEHPRLLERPVLVKGAKAVAARAVERAADFVGQRAVFRPARPSPSRESSSTSGRSRTRRGPPRR
ncbi:MAG: ArsC/Spx/MgsR family protein [Halobacteria archaeon]